MSEIDVVFSGELTRLLARAGAADATVVAREGLAIVSFGWSGRLVRWEVALRRGDDVRADVQRTERWRGLHQVVSARVAAVRSGIEDVDRAFLPYIVDERGEPIGERLLALLPGRRP